MVAANSDTSATVSFDFNFTVRSPVKILRIDL
jgi:hypothetical protein